MLRAYKGRFMVSFPVTEDPYLVVLFSLQHILSGHRRPMFELADQRPPHWPTLEIPPRPGDELNCSQQSG